MVVLTHDRDQETGDNEQEGELHLDTPAPAQTKLALNLKIRVSHNQSAGLVVVTSVVCTGFCWPAGRSGSSAASIVMKLLISYQICRLTERWEQILGILQS